MCAGCWVERFGKVAIDNEAVRRAAEAIAEVYSYAFVGGNLHCEIDDWNIEDPLFDGEFKPWDPNASSEQLAAETDCWNQLKALSEAERASALALHDGYWG